MREDSPKFLNCYPLEGGVKFWAWLNILILPIKEVSLILIVALRADIFFESYVLKVVHNYCRYHSVYKYIKFIDNEEKVDLREYFRILSVIFG